MTKLLIRLSACLGSSGLLMIDRGSYMSAHVLLNLLYKLRKKKIKCEALFTSNNVNFMQSMLASYSSCSFSSQEVNIEEVSKY